jgi:hypothetical protein
MFCGAISFSNRIGIDSEKISVYGLKGLIAECKINDIEYVSIQRVGKLEYVYSL